MFAFVNVGDCKAFLWSKESGTVTDLTRANRRSLYDCKDPGGRLGPYKDMSPDLRNLETYYTFCDEGDIIFMMSDGVHDNFDPQFLGKLPSDFGLAATDNKWDQLTSDVKLCEEVKNRAMVEAFQGQIRNVKMTPKHLTRALTSYAYNITSKSREFMELYPNKKQSDSYLAYPGKMDHATAITLRVGRKDKKATKM